MVTKMTENIEKISVLMTVDRDGRRDSTAIEKKRKKLVGVRQENGCGSDSVTISAEARRLLACDGGGGGAEE
jgi:hypothetical protein